jgi:hypothetical protein
MTRSSPATELDAAHRCVLEAEQERAIERLARAALQRRRGRPGEAATPAPLAIGLASIALLLPSAPASAQTHIHDPDHEAMLHAGNAAPYPKLRDASRANRRKARTLRSATLRAAKRFDMLEKATQLGYVAQGHLSPLYRPGLQHFRKHGVGFWGRVLDPRQPQALVFWCPSTGDCHLAAFMYRAPARRTPPTYGGLLGWHRHHERAPWMTHIWLTNRARTSLAQCAPFNALHRHNPRLAWEPYQPDVPMIDDPCPDTTALPSGLSHQGPSGPNRHFDKELLSGRTFQVGAEQRPAAVVPEGDAGVSGSVHELSLAL